MGRRDSWQVGLFRVLLLLCPRWFRREYGDEMVELFRWRLERSRGIGARSRLWGRVVKDVVTTAAALRRGRLGGDESKGRGSSMDPFWQDVRHAAHRLVRAPVFTLGAVTLLAIGIGANTTVFSMVDSLLFRPPPWDDPEQVVNVYQDSDDGEPNSTSYPAYRDMAASDAFAAVTATTPASVVWNGPDGPVPLDVEFTTASYLDVLGLAPARGRWFEPRHDQVGAERVAVLSHTAWLSRFGGDPDVLGATLTLNGHPVTVVGIGPQRVSSSYPPFVTDLWLSISSVDVGGAFRVANLERREDHWYDVKARLAPGVNAVQAQAAMDALAARLAAEYPELNQGRDITVFEAGSVRVHPDEDGDLFAGGAVLSVVVLLVLLLACANLANLLLVRGIGRDGEMAVRRALGAGRLRVGRLFLLEAMLLSVMGGAIGLLLARSAMAVVPALPLPFPAALELALDGRVALFTLVLMLGTGLLFGTAPAVRASRGELADTLRDESRTSRGSRGLARVRSFLVAVQVAASLVLVLGTGLMARSLTALRGADRGLDVDRVAYVRTDFSQAGLTTEEMRVQLQDVQERIAALPAVTSVAATSRLPAQGGGSTTTVVEGYQPPAGTDAVELDFLSVTDDYFQTLGIPILVGRTFGEDDVLGGPTAVIVNETAARTFWGSTDVIGRRMRSQTSESWRTVVGVAGDAPVSSLSEEVRPMFYFAERQVTLSNPYLVFRAETDPAALIPAVRRALASLRPAPPVAAQGTLAGHFGESLSAPRVAAAFMGGFSFLAVLLAGLGIYAVVSFTVAGRASELGLRMALGAHRGRVIRSVVTGVAWTVFVGLAAGTGLMAVVAPQLGGVLYGVEPLDPLTFVGAVGFLLAVAWLAAWIPARRVLAMDPVVALRSE